MKTVKPSLIILTLISVSFWLMMDVTSNVQVNRTTLHLSGNNKTLQNYGGSIQIAFLSDLHIDSSPEALLNLKGVMATVVAARSDVILFGGDYIKNPDAYNIDQHQPVIAKAMAATNGIPTIAVLGNHDNWTSSAKWHTSLTHAGITVLENTVVKVKSLDLCVRGLGDHYSEQFSYVGFPESCINSKRLSLTHDPAAAFDPRVTGLVLAGHTHCGQISLPFIGSLWVPTDAPKESHCGLYQDADRQVFVTAG